MSNSLRVSALNSWFSAAGASLEKLLTGMADTAQRTEEPIGAIREALNVHNDLRESFDSMLINKPSRDIDAMEMGDPNLNILACDTKFHHRFHSLSCSVEQLECSLRSSS